MRGLTAEQDLAIACVRRAFGQSVQARPGANLNWDDFAEVASKNGLGPVVYAGLAGLDIAVPDRVRNRLRGEHAMSLLRTKIALEPNLRQALASLEQRNLHPIVLKGAALAYVAYRQPQHRTLADIDVLLPEGDIATADEALRRDGYTVLDVDLGHGHHHLPPYISPDGQFSIELHHDIVTDDSPYRVDLEEVWRRSHFRDLAGVRARVMARTDALLHVCLHLAFGHRYQWYSLRTLVDVLALTTAEPAELDWTLFTRTVQRSRTAGTVYWPLRASRDLLGAPVPAWVLERLAPLPPLRRLAEMVMSTSYIIDGVVKEGAGTGVLYDLVREVSLYSGCSTGRQIQALWRSIFPPADAVTHLPAEVAGSRLRYLLALTQPARLARGVFAAVRLVARLSTSAS